MTHLDPTDTQLIGLLRANARMSVTELSRHLKVSRATVSSRIHRLEAGGAITGYTILTRGSHRRDGIRAWMSIAVQGTGAKVVVKRLLGEPSVAALHDTNGRWDLLVELQAANLGDMSSALERIRMIEGIRASETSIHLVSFRTTARG